MPQAPNFISFVLYATMLLFPLTSSGQSKFLFSNENTLLSSCTLPSSETYIVITGMRDGDIYISRKGPGGDFDYTFHFYPFESYIQPDKPFLITVDTEAAELCEKIENGDVSEATLKQFRAKVDADAYWWEVTPPSGNYWPEYSPRTIDYPSEDGSDLEYTGNGYISARMTIFATPDEFTIAQKRINGTGKTNVIERGMSATVFTLEGIDTNHAFFESITTSRDHWRSCAFGSEAERGGKTIIDETIIKGISAACYSEDGYIEADPELAFYNGETASADCLEGILYLGEYGEAIEYDGEGYWQTTGSALDMARIYKESDHIYGVRSAVFDFELLCPANNEKFLKLGCETGNEEACSQISKE